MIPAFPKPGQIRKQKPAFREFADGRLVFDLTTKAGRDGYTYSVRKMFEWQGKRCGLIIAPQCKEKQGRWPLSMMTFDHGAGRGMGGGKRTDRVEDENGKRLVDKDGRPINLAVCPWCNSLKGSRPLSDFEVAIFPEQSRQSFARLEG